MLILITILSASLNQRFSSIQLEINGTTSSTNNNYGIGTISLTGPWANPSASHSKIIAAWSTGNSSSRNVDFVYDLTLFVTRANATLYEQKLSSYGTAFSAENNSNAFWRAWFYAYQPTYFTKYNLTITKPLTETWTLYTALDPLFSITTNADTFWIGDPLTTSATLSVTTGQANLTLIDPNGNYVVNQTRTVSGAAVSFTDILFDDGNTYPAGEYTLCISYDDGNTYSQTSLGFRSKTLTIIHDTGLAGVPSTVNVVYSTTGTFFIRVRFTDLDTGQAVGGATVVGNWTPLFPTVPFDQAGGEYEAELPRDSQPAGDYRMRVNASRPYYDSDWTYVTVHIFAETRPNPSISGYNHNFSLFPRRNISNWNHKCKCRCELDRSTTCRYRNWEWAI